MDPYVSLRHANFRRLIFSYAASTIAREAQIVVVGWQVYNVTRDPLSLGLIGLAEAVPFIAVALFAGHVADRAPRRRVAMWGMFGMLLSAVALVAFTAIGLIARGSVWPIYLVIFLSGIARSFTRPAFTALSAEVIPREVYANAVAWRSSTWQFAAVAGPALGGLVYGFGGATVAYSGVAVMMAIALLGVASVAHEGLPLQGEELSIGESLSLGIRFLKDQPVLLAAMTLDLFSVLFGGATALLPVFARLLGAGPRGLGLLRAAPAAGSLVIGLWMAHRPPLQRAGRALLASVALFGLTMIAFAVSRNFLLSLFLLTLSGMADNVSVVIRSTMIQTLTPHHLLGRVASVNQIFIGSSNEIGAFESGLAARLMGTVPSVIFGGIMTLVVVASIAWKAPRLRSMREIVTAD
jgi:MFS family permease